MAYVHINMGRVDPLDFHQVLQIPALGGNLCMVLEEGPYITYLWGGYM